MRNISSNGLAQLAEKNGTEPICIVAVDWSGTNSPIFYADRDVDTIPGKIMEVGDLDNVVDVSNSNNSQQISIKLVDHDGSIKHLMDTNDIHQRDAWVYQYFDGLALTDKFLLFKGKVSSPITWSEGERTVSFDIISQIEDKEFGFSAEEGDFPYIPKTLIGRPWPSIFGTAIDVPALQFNQAVTGTTTCGLGILSGEKEHMAVPLGAGNCGLGQSLGAMQNQAQVSSIASALWVGKNKDRSAQLRTQTDNLLVQMSQTVGSYVQQQACAEAERAKTLAEAKKKGLGCNPVQILGGEDFPQNTPIELDVNGGLFRGTMHNDMFTISSRRNKPDEDKAKELAQKVDSAACTSPTTGVAQYFDIAEAVPPGTGNYPSKTRDQYRIFGIMFCQDGTSNSPTLDQVAQHFWADAGSRVVMSSDEPITYVVSIVPGEVLAVKAYKTLDGRKQLVNVPQDLYRVESHVYGAITAVQIVVTKPLSKLTDQGWEDGLFATFRSDVGPNVVDILEYIVTTYTDFGLDSTTFNAVRTLVDPFPANFPVLDQKNVMGILQEIAFQARCALWLSNGTFYIKYLPLEPDADDTIIMSDVQNKSIQVELTTTEDVVTKMIVTYHISWANGNNEEPEKVIFRHNIAKYGVKPQEFDFYIYNQPDIVEKVGTFWLIRKANTWKKMKFKTYLTKLNLETFDCVNLSFPGKNFIATDDVKAIVEQASYNSQDNTVDFTCVVPVRSGEMEPYKFYWPSTLSVTDTFPTPAEIASGNAGSAGIGAGASGTLPIGFTNTIGNMGGTVFVGGPNVVYGPFSDRGNKTPTDFGFTAQPIIPSAVFALISNVLNPNPFLKLNYLSPFQVPQPPDKTLGPTVIDIRKTEIFDSLFNGSSATLDDVIESIHGNRIYLATDAKWSERGKNGEYGPFHFVYDTDFGKFGAGTAFLRDDE